MLVKATVLPEHINELAITMQEADKQSIQLLSGLTPEQGLYHSVSHSPKPSSWLLNSQIVAISGVSQLSVLSDHACPWLLCSDEIRKHPRLFLESTKEWVNEQLAYYPILRNVVWSGHHRSIKWLKWLGFTLTGPYPIGIDGAMFYLNEKRA